MFHFTLDLNSFIPGDSPILAGIAAVLRPFLPQSFLIRIWRRLMNIAARSASYSITIHYNQGSRVMGCQLATN